MPETSQCQHCGQPVRFGLTEHGYRGFIHDASGLSVCIEPRQAAAVAAVVDTISEWLDTLAPSFTCTEAETLAELLNAYHQPNRAAAFITAHAEGDEPGDMHHRSGDDDDDPALAELQDLAVKLDRCPVCCRPWAEHADALGRAKCIPIVPVSNALAAMQRHAEHAASAR